MRTDRLLRLLICAAFVFYKSIAAADDEITVPDVSGFNDPKAMKAAAGPDMVGVIMATKNKPLREVPSSLPGRIHPRIRKPHAAAP